VQVHVKSNIGQPLAGVQVNGDLLYKAHLGPAAKEIGIVGHFGWHTFRGTYATLLKGNGEGVKVVQELMRHANISVTMNIYAQAITQTKRDAQSRVVRLLLDENEEKPSTGVIGP
jgi:integrase